MNLPSEHTIRFSINAQLIRDILLDPLEHKLRELGYIKNSEDLVDFDYNTEAVFNKCIMPLLVTIKSRDKEVEVIKYNGD